MLNYKLKKHQKIIIGIICFLFIMLFMALFMGKNSIDNKVVKDDLIKKSTDKLQSEETVENYQEKESGDDSEVNIDDLCNTNTVEEYGEIDPNKDILVYETECIINLYSDNTTDSLIRFYVRDADGTFNKKIYSVFNTSIFGGSTWAEIVDDNKIKLHRVNNSNDSVIVDIYGNELDSSNDSNDRGKYVSPDGKYIVEIEAFEIKDDPKIIKIIDAKSGEIINEYKIDGVGAFGAYVADWDKESVYVAGGIYEFSSPARLWRIDIQNNSIEEYKNLQGLEYPVSVFVDDKVAFACDNDLEDYDFYESEKKKDIDLYMLDLKNGKKTKIATENASNAFFSIDKYNDNLFYFVAEDVTYLKKINLKTRKVSIVEKFEDNAIAKSQLKGKNIIFQHLNKYYILFLDSEEKKLFGEGSEEPGFRVPTDRKEYISEIVNWIEAR